MQTHCRQPPALDVERGEHIADWRGGAGANRLEAIMRLEANREELQ
jgi:hypothetical protein